MSTRSKQQEKDRRARLEEMKRAQRAKERRQTGLFIGIAVLIGLALIAVPGVGLYNDWRNDPARRPVTDFGVATAAASCDAVQTTPAAGQGDHVGPGTPQPELTTVKYATVPPTFGQHYADTAGFDRDFYTSEDRPRMERLVHNLEHGYTVIWYDDTVEGEQLEALRDLVTKLRSDDATRFVIASAWDPAYGAFPDGKHIGLAHWGAKQGVRQLCGSVSGEAVDAFMRKYPKSDSPEPLGG